MMYREFNISFISISSISVFHFRKKIINILNYIHKNPTHFMRFRFLRKLGPSCILCVCEDLWRNARV